MNSLPDKIEQYKRELQEDPDNLTVLLKLAQTYMEIGDSSLAEEIFLTLLGKSPDHSEAKVGLAESLINQNKQKEAESVLNTVLTIEPTSVKALELKKKNESASSKMLLNANGSIETAIQKLDLPSLSGERPTINFSDVGGMDELKEEIKTKIIYPLQHPELYEAYGKKIGGGILFYGPPGCGKTYLARATAGEIHANFISVGINQILDMWLGSSEKNLHALFEEARRNTPCVMFFDEVDALGASRTDLRQSAGRHLINQFLAEMDGDQYSNEGILILGATNAPWHLDSAFRRPGRFDRILFVPPPDEKTRSEILKVSLKGKPVSDMDFSLFAKKSEGLSGADIQAVVNLAVEEKLKQAMKTGNVVPLATQDILLSLKSIRSSVKEWFGAAKNYAVYSNESGIYDDILRYLKLL